VTLKNKSYNLESIAKEMQAKPRPCTLYKIEDENIYTCEYVALIQ
jgi:hypothetical protein